MLQKHWGVQPSELDRLPFFEIQFMLEDLEEQLQAEAKENERQAADLKAQQAATKQPKAKKPSLPKKR